MIWLEQLREVAGSLRKNRLRAFLTGFSVAWGIFIFIILLGSGKGLENGVRKQFSGAAMNSYWTGGRRTSLPYKGYPEGRIIKLEKEDYDAVKQLVSGHQASSYRFTVPNVSILRHRNSYGIFQVRCAEPEYPLIELITLIEGRFLNWQDEHQKRKVTIISRKVKEMLFSENEPAVGSFISAQGVNFLVVGVFDETEAFDNDKCIYIPVSTGKAVYAGETSEHVSMMFKDGMTVAESEAMTSRIVHILARRKQFNPDDERALWQSNNMKNYYQFIDLITMIELFVAVVGILTIVAGIVGVSNIMTIVVKDRTREIGIRKALGARPWSVISTVLLEAVAITALAGYIGLFLGVIILDIVSSLLPEDGYFINPAVNTGLALTATLLLVLSGLVAGFFPALRASRIKPIEALRDE